MMKRSRLLLFLLSIVILPLISTEAAAFWVWTPETNKWVNPKFAVKDTPGEQLLFAIDFYNAKEYKEAVRELKKLMKHYPKAREAPDAQFYIGKCMQDQERLFEAFKQYQLVIDKYPFSERSSEIVQIQYEIALKMLEGEGSRGVIVDTFVSADYNVIDIFRTVIKNAPYGDLAAPSQYKIGLYLLEKRLYQESRDEFEKVLNDYPESEWTKAAKYQIAVTDAARSTGAQYDQRITQAAVEEFKEFVEIYPDAELSKEAKDQINKLREKEAENNFVVAVFYEKQKNYKAAKIYYQAILDDYNNTSWFRKSLQKLQALADKE